MSMRPAAVAAGIVLAASALIGPALAGEPDVNAIVGRAIGAWELVTPAVQIAVVTAAALLWAWRMWLHRPQPQGLPHHTADEIYTLLNSVSQRIEDVARRLDAHIDAGGCRPV